MKQCVILILLLLPLASAQFADIPGGHWAEEAVYLMTEGRCDYRLPRRSFPRRRDPHALPSRRDAFAARREGRARGP